MASQRVNCALLGAGLALLGAGLVEALILAGLRPLGPLGWPAVAMIAAAAFFGVFGFLAGALVTAAYYLLNVAQTERFPEFFANPTAGIAWASGVLIAGAAVIVLRSRLQAAQMASLLDRSLRESESRFRHLTELSSDWYWEQDQNFRFTFISGALRGRTGIDTPEIRGKARWDFPALNLSPEDWERHRAQLERHEAFRDLLIERSGPDGRSHWASVSGDPVFDDYGRFTGYRGVGRDITAEKEAEQALRRSEARLRVIADSIPALVAYIDTQERYRFNNRAYEEWFGFPRDRFTGRTIREIWGEERYALMRPNVARALSGERLSYEYTMQEGGVERHVLANYVPEIDAQGGVQGFFVLAHDITPLAAVRNEQSAARERLENALGGSSAALWDADLRTGRVYLSEAWAEIVGNPRGDTVTTVEELLQLVHPDDVDAGKRILLEAMKGVRPGYAFEHRVRSSDGEWKWILSRGRVTERDPATGRARRMIGMNIDITDRKRMEVALQSVAHSDPLTGLANRMLLADRIRFALARGRRSGSACALLYLDIDRFKPVNDTLGHAAGDRLLKDFAERLRGCVRQSDTVARLGGDEFVVLLEDLKGEASATLVAEKMLESARAPTRIDGNDILVTTSIGIAYGGDDANEEAWMKRADAALYQAKRAGRDRLFVAK